MYDRYGKNGNGVQRELEAIKENRKEMEMDDKKRIEHHFSESVYQKFLNLLNKVTKAS